MKLTHIFSLNIFSVFIALLVCNVENVHAQLSYGGAPYSGEIKYPKQKYVKMLRPDQNEVQQIMEYQPIDKNEPFQFAYPFGVDLNPSNSGEWNNLPNGDRIWRIGIESEGAFSLNLIFDQFEIPEGARVFIYDPQKTWILGAFTHRNNKASGILATQPVPGDRLMVEYYVPAGINDHGLLSIGQVAHDFVGIYSLPELKDGNFGSSGDCNLDINCPDGTNWQDHKKSVTRLLINGVEYCTGVLVNNTRKDAIPYILTAGHCIEDSSDAAQTIAVFNYESPYCNGPDGFTNQAISGASLKASISDKLDFSLVQLSEYPPFNFQPYYAGWSLLTNVPSRTTTIHHPSADVKKISLDYDPPVSASYGAYDSNTFWKILEWDIGTTESGSSGAPLFDNLGLLIGTLTGGDARCSNSVNDYFQKFSSSWDKYGEPNKQLKVWLDPIDAGAAFIEGFDPYEPAIKSCDTLRNWEDNEILEIIELVPGSEDDGIWTGHNSYKYTKYAEKFLNYNPRKLVSAVFKIGQVVFDSYTDSVKFKVWTGTVQPEDEIITKSLPLSYFNDSTDFILNFDTIVEFEGNFWIGYEIFYDNLQQGPITDQFSLFQVQPRADIGGTNSAYYYKNQWTRFDTNYPISMRTALGIEAVVCGEIPSLGIGPGIVNDLSDEVTLRPNPASDIIYIDLPEFGFSDVRIKVFSLSGTKLIDKLISDRNETVNLSISDLKTGIYLLHIEGDGYVANKKLSVVY